MLRQREPLARAALEVIASFATVESWMLELYLDLTGGSKTVAAEMFLTLESRSARSGAIRPLVARLGERYQRLYRALEKLLKTRAGERDKLAHWVWGISPHLPDALLLANPKTLATLDSLDPDIREHIYVYRQPDFDKITAANYKLAGHGMTFRFIVMGHAANREDRLYHRLCAEPDLADILRRQDERAQSQPKETE